MKSTILRLVISLVVFSSTAALSKENSGTFPVFSPSASGMFINTIAGTGNAGFAGDGGRAFYARISSPGNIAFDKSGNLFFSDQNNNRIRKIDTKGFIKTVAGTGVSGYSGDGGLASNATLHHPGGLSIRDDGTIYFADTYNNVIRKIDPFGMIFTIAGTGDYGFKGDGRSAAEAQLQLPSDVCLDTAGNLFIADSGNHVIRKVDIAGYINTIAGIGNSYGYSGDGSAATKAQLWFPTGVTFAPNGNLYIADKDNDAIRMISISNGTIYSVIAPAKSQSNPSKETIGLLSKPTKVVFDQLGNLLVVDSLNNQIRKLGSSGLETLAGTGVSGFSGDGGPAEQAALQQPAGIGIDATGNIYISDSENHRIRMVGLPTPLYAYAGDNQIGFLGSALQLNPTVSGGNGSYLYTWTIKSGPNLNQAQFSDPYIKNTQFTPAISGMYTLEFKVNDQVQQPVVSQISIIVLSINPGNTLFVTDSLDSLVDLSGNQDYDNPGDRELVIRWNFDQSYVDLNNVNDIHIYIKTDNSDYVFMGKPDSVSSTYIRWLPNNPTIAPAFSEGPQFGHSYSFKIYFLTRNGTPFFYGPFTNPGPVEFLETVTVTPTPELPTEAPTGTPTATEAPTEAPTQPGEPTIAPTLPAEPTAEPTEPVTTPIPTSPVEPTVKPTEPVQPTVPGEPTIIPTNTSVPVEPTLNPTLPAEPTVAPTNTPVPGNPTIPPTDTPVPSEPTVNPTAPAEPTTEPTIEPTNTPVPAEPTVKPSDTPVPAEPTVPVSPTPTATATSTPTPGIPVIRIEPLSLYFTNKQNPDVTPTPTAPSAEPTLAQPSSTATAAQTSTTPAATATATAVSTPVIPAGTVIVCDNEQSYADLSNKTDTDADVNRALVIRWNLNFPPVEHYKVYVSDNGAKAKLLGDTVSDATCFIWREGEKVEGSFKNGPQTNHSYLFSIQIVPEGSHPDLYSCAGPVAFKTGVEDYDPTMMSPYSLKAPIVKSQDRNILLRSGIINPSKGQNTVVSSRSAQAKTSQQGRHILLQFQQIPTDAEQKALAARGIQLLQYIPNNAYWASVAQRSVSINKVSQGGGVTYSLASSKLVKLSPEISKGSFPHYAIMPDGRYEVAVRVFKDVSEKEAATVISSMGAELLDTIDINLYRAAVVPGDIYTLASLDIVEWVEPIAPPYQITNAVSSQRIHVNEVHNLPYELNGKDVIVGVWDGGTIFAHNDLASRLTVVDSSAVSNHATHVAGTIAGNGSGNPAAKGMAYNATIRSYDWNYDISEMRAGVDAGIRLSNHSYGLITGWYWNGSGWVDYGSTLFGQYMYVSQGYDSVVYDKDLIIFKSAGNDRNEGPGGSQIDGPYDCIPGDSIGKNIITIGATMDDDNMTYFSSWGPSNDGRVKPDLCANGYGLTSTLPNNSYGSYSGTSMASPSACGAGTLLYQYYMNEMKERPAASTIKALLIHAALDLGRPGPDYEYGWGLINDKVSADLIKSRSWKTGSIAHGSKAPYQITVISGQPELKATLVWTDVPGSTSAAVALVNNLDMVLRSPSGQLYYPWVLNPASPNAAAAKGVNNVDNVEQVYVSNPEAGTWTLEIQGTSIPSGPQNYSLVTDSLNQIDNSKPFTIYNDGTGTLKVTSMATTDGDWVSMYPQAPFDIAPGEQKKIAVSIDFAKAPIGNATSQIVIESNDSTKSPYPNGVYINTEAEAVPTPTPTTPAAPTATPAPTDTPNPVLPTVIPTIPGEPTVPPVITPTPTLPPVVTPLPGITPTPTLPGSASPTSAPTLPVEPTTTPTLPGTVTPSPTVPGNPTEGPTNPAEPTVPAEPTATPTLPEGMTPHTSSNSARRTDCIANIARGANSIRNAD